MIQITFPFGPVFGTAGITVLFALEFSLVSAVCEEEDVHLIVSFASSHPSFGINQITWSHSHCLLYVNTWSLIFAVPKCIHFWVDGSWILISTLHQLELFVQKTLTLFQSISAEGFKTVGAANENQIKTLNIAERIMKNLCIWIV